MKYHQPSRNMCYNQPKVKCSMPYSVLRQKGESQNDGYKKTKHARFPEKLTLLNP